MTIRQLLFASLIPFAIVIGLSCNDTTTGGGGGGSTSGGSTSGGSTSGGSTGGTTTSRTLTEGQSVLQSVSVTVDGQTRTCNQVSRDTSSCQSSREALGLSGEWLDFSCNVVEGLATASKASTTSLASATYVTLSTPDLPDYTSNYYTGSGSFSFTAYNALVSGTYSSLYAAFTPAFPDPNAIAQQSGTMYVPITTSHPGTSQTMGMGTVGMTINGLFVYDSVAGNTDNIFAEGLSFDECGGHADQSKAYHIHGEPYSISYDDNKLIGVMMDGYFIYGRKDNDGSTPGSIATLSSNTSDIYKYGGHVGSDPLTGSGSSFHYHVTEWEGCYHETGNPLTKASNDGETNDSFNSPAGDCTGGSWIDAWFLTGHGNGSTFETLPTGIGTQNPSQSTTAVRYYYGTAGSCTGCP